MSLSANDLYEFGPFRLDPRDSVLYRGTERVPLTLKVFETLRTLVENHGRVVTKDELMKHVWPDTFVEEGNLTVNIFLLRKELGEGAEGPKYIETVPKRGYRFVAPVRQTSRPNEPGSAAAEAEKMESAEPTAAPGISPAVSPGPPARDAALGSGARLGVRLAVGALITISAGMAAWLMLNSRPAAPKVIHVVQLTHSGMATGVTTDGARLYISQAQDGRMSIVQAPASGGETTPFPTPFRNVEILDMSPTKTELLVDTFDAPDGARLVWALPLAGGPPRRIGNILSHSAKWSPGGKRIAFSEDDGTLYLANGDGSNVRKLADEGGQIDSWSPDGHAVRFTRTNRSTGGSTLWEVQSDGSGLRPILPERQDANARWGEGQCCGGWMPDGKYFVFREAFSPKVGLWALREGKQFGQFGKSEPVEIYAASLDILNFVVDPDANRLLAVGQNQNRELVRFDSGLHQFVPLLEGIGAVFVRWSPDRKWLIYTSLPGFCLWKMKSDGSERRQLTFPPLQAFAFAWAPDGKRLAFHALPPGKPGKICLISAEGGTPQTLLAREPTGEDVPNWSPDGNTLMFQRTWLDQAGATTRAAICMLDLATQRVTELTGSEDLGPPSWSPDGRYVAAQSDDFHKLMLFDFRSQKWTQLAQGAFINSPQWSQDSRSVIYQDAAAGDEQPIYRISVPAGQPEKLATRRQVLRADVNRFRLVSLDPHDQPVAVLIRRNADVYALDLGSSE
jgi:DNA-binding winged helix-turn-helix (wHTH) protein/Tol biopolymer transport system component